MGYLKMKNFTGWALVFPAVLVGCAGGGGSPASSGNATMPAVVAASPPGTVSAGVSVHAAVAEGSLLPSDIAMDPDFMLAIVGVVGKNGATSTVSKVTITGVNTSLTGNSLTITHGAGTEIIENAPNGSTGYSDAALEERLRTKTIGMGTQADNAEVPGTVSGSAESPFQAMYMTFGGWRHCGMGCTTPLATGMYVYGNATQPGNIPTFGTATYNGFALGTANDQDYETFAGAGDSEWHSQANMTAVVDFSKRTLAFSTSGTVTPVTNVNTQVTTVVATPQLNMSGTLTYAEGSNLFSGTVSDAGGRSGTAMGRFYGPAVQEIGGVYAVGTNDNGHVGYFAGKK